MRQRQRDDLVPQVSVKSHCPATTRLGVVHMSADDYQLQFPLASRGRLATGGLRQGQSSANCASQK